MISKYLRKISNLLQGAQSSFKRHNSELERESAYETEKQIGYDRLQRNAINDPELRIDDLLKIHTDVAYAVDVGSGAGWGSAAISSRIPSVFAIEPSEAGITIAKKLYSAEEFKNITWINGFAEEVLPTLHFDKPTLFFTGCVLSHLRDAEVERICAAICAVAPQGSVLAFDECWGQTEWHQIMWHVRTTDWWRKQLAGWELDFHGPLVPEKDAYKGQYHKGFWGVKK